MSTTEIIRALEALGGQGTVNQIVNKMSEQGIPGDLKANVKNAKVCLRNRDLVSFEIINGINGFVWRLKQ